MPVTSGLSTTAKSGQSYFRITSPSFKTNNPTDHVKVVNGEGSLRNPHGARYNYPGAVTVYLTEDIETCLAEKMFYFHRETLRAIDISHHTGVIPPFSKTFVLWEIKFQNDVNDIFDMTVRNAHTSFNIFPSLSINPSQDYEHLKAKRAHIQSDGYNGIRVPSSRTTNGGNMVVLFHDQSRNVQQIRAYDVQFRLVTQAGVPFNNHASDILDFTSGEVTITAGVFFPPAFMIGFPAGGSIYHNWQRVNFNH